VYKIHASDGGNVQWNGSVRELWDSQLGNYVLTERQDSIRAVNITKINLKCYSVVNVTSTVKSVSYKLKRLILLERVWYLWGKYGKKSKSSPWIHTNLYAWGLTWQPRTYLRLIMDLQFEPNFGFYSLDPARILSGWYPKTPLGVRKVFLQYSEGEKVYYIMKCI